MLASALFASCLMLVISTSADAAAVRPRVVADATTGRLAARAVISGGNTCYFRCPDSFNRLAVGGTGQETVTLSYYDPEQPGYCGYTSEFQIGYACWYTSEGRLDTDATNEPGCPDFAVDAGCTPTGSGPTDPNHFKRSTRRGLTRAQQIIRARQYRPKKAVRRQV